MVAQVPPRPPAEEEMRVRVLVAGAAAVGASALPSGDSRPVQLLWNTSTSVPAGLYLAVARYPSCGALAVIRLPERIRAFAAHRGYLPISSVMIKPVAGRSGSMVCRYGLRVSIDGQIVAIAKHSDFAGRPLPRWQGCHRLDSAKIFLLSPQSDSFDSRYFGPIHRSHVQGSALPIVLVGTSSDPAHASRCGAPRDTPDQ
jgi:conjugative transfer signal peptidase TraF